MSQSRKVIFEKIRFVYYPIVKYYLWRGWTVHVFDFERHLKRYGWAKRMIHRGDIHRIYVSPLIQGHGEGIEQAKILYHKITQKNFEEEIAQLYQSPEVELVFMKGLAEPIVRSLYIHSYFEGQKAGNQEQDILFIPDVYPFYRDWLLQEGTVSIQPLENIQMRRWSFFFPFLLRGWEKIKYLIMAETYLWIKIFLMLVGRIFHRHSREIQSFPYAMAIHYAFKIAKGFDFLIDEKSITKKEVLFLLYIPVKNTWLSSHQSQGYHFLNVRKQIRFKGCLQSSCQYGKLLKVSRALLKAPFYVGYPLPFLRAYLCLLRVYLDYLLVFHRLDIKNYIYSNQESVNQIALNILLRQQGTKTWDYAYSIGGGYLYAENREGIRDKQAFLFSFLNSDCQLAANEDFVHYHKMHFQKVRQYYVIGNIYSGIIHDLQEKLGSGQLERKYLGRELSPRQRIITFFDTSFVDAPNCVTTFDHAIYFYQDMLRLLEEKEDILLIIKPAKDEAYYIEPKEQWSSPQKGEKIVNLWNILRSNRRVCWAGAEGNAPQIIAMSDLVITHAFSSPTAEALGAGKKAFWYQSRGRQPFLYYDIPGLVVHGYDSLRERMDTLLRMEEKEYQAYLNKYIKGKLDPFMDGLALTRFRNLLRAHEKN